MYICGGFPILFTGYLAFVIRFAVVRQTRALRKEPREFPDSGFSETYTATYGAYIRVEEGSMYVIASFVLHCRIMSRRHKKRKDI